VFITNFFSIYVERFLMIFLISLSYCECVPSKYHHPHLFRFTPSNRFTFFKFAVEETFLNWYSHAVMCCGLFVVNVDKSLVGARVKYHFTFDFLEWRRRVTSESLSERVKCNALYLCLHVFKQPFIPGWRLFGSVKITVEK
jgi:hypothetical protein